MSEYALSHAVEYVLTPVAKYTNSFRGMHLLMSSNILTQVSVFTVSRKRPIHSVIYAIQVMIYINSCRFIFTNSIRDSQIRGMC